MTIGPDGMAKLIGSLVIHPELFKAFSSDLDEFAKIVSDKGLSEGEKRILTDRDTIDLIKDFISKIDIKYGESGDVISRYRKGR